MTNEISFLSKMSAFDHSSPPTRLGGVWRTQHRTGRPADMSGCHV